MANYKMVSGIHCYNGSFTTYIDEESADWEEIQEKNIVVIFVDLTNKTLVEKKKIIVGLVNYPVNLDDDALDYEEPDWDYEKLGEYDSDYNFNFHRFDINGFIIRWALNIDEESAVCDFLDKHNVNYIVK